MKRMPSATSNSRQSFHQITDMDLDQDDMCTQLFSRYASTEYTSAEDDFFFMENEQEDACTQTDGSAVCNSVPDVDGPEMEVPYESQEPTIFTEMVSQPFLRRRRGHYFPKENAYLLKSMKEKHRENERLRHHSLNQHLKDICKSVPGSAEDGKETKVVMMQRIISYMSYLENSIKTLCSKLSTKPNHRWTVLTSSLKDIEKAGTWQKESAATLSEDSMDCSIIPSMSLRLKLSSPTIDSTTDPTTCDSSVSMGPPLSEDCSSGFPEEEPEDATVPSYHGFTQNKQDNLDFDQEDNWCTSTEKIEVQNSESIDAFLDNNTDFHQSLFEFSSTAMENKMIDSPCEVKWLGSPEKSPLTLQGRTNKFGIQCDLQTPEDQVCDLTHTLLVSPDKVIPVQLVEEQNKNTYKACLQFPKALTNSVGGFREIKTTRLSAKIPYGSKKISEICQAIPHPSGTPWREDADFYNSHANEAIVYLQDDSQMVSLRPSKRKQSSPKRTPLFNISNLIQNYPAEFNENLKESWLKQELKEPQTHSDPGIVMTTDTPQEVHPKEEHVEMDEHFITQSALEEECYKVLREASVAEPTKLDLRKSSWMNGFMMYSRIHRKRFIKKNPGSHTAVISKLMGHAWRSMTVEEQRPYTEKAKFCAQELQKIQDANCQTDL
ncbi:hypothetical protein EGW08_011057 [Elysia chlorotica]|uniref:Sex-determining region Y protein n=1 Tax=Elysia chlorotica TaxID=188477 RepID=A0A3S0ZMI4_ELYCH|nr:hypothetical protein EGW08_011057 [Elysia chlorotica]